MTKQRPFRFGVIAGSATSRREWVEKAHKIEALGYATLYNVDHFTSDFPPEVALMAAADATETLRVGSWVFCNDARHPTVLAKQAATLDLLSDGRLELGIGAGWQQSEYAQVGIPYDAPGIRINRFEEAIHILKGLFADEPLTFSGKYYSIQNLNGSPKPVQRPHPPFYIGGGGKRVLSIAAREANIVGLLPIAGTGSWYNMADGTAESTQRKVDWIRQAAGSRIDELELHTGVFVVNVTEQRSQVTQNIGSRFGLTGMQIQQLTHMLVGTIEQMCEDLLQRRERFGISYISVLEKDMQTFAPIVERLANH